MDYKYRAYLIKDDIIVYVDDIDWKNEKIYYGPPRDRGIYSVSFSDLILMKNIGVCDKDKRTVFEGDIIFNKSNKYKEFPEKMIVQISKDSIFLTNIEERHLIKKDSGCITKEENLIEDIIKTSKVIGNVFLKIV